MAKKDFVGYEYHNISVKRSMASVYADGYENFGWELEDTEEQNGTLLERRYISGLTRKVLIATGRI